jgi:hypothetical protein
LRLDFDVREMASRRWVTARGPYAGIELSKKRPLDWLLLGDHKIEIISSTKMGRYTIRFELICGTKIAQMEDTIWS